MWLVPEPELWNHLFKHAGFSILLSMKKHPFDIQLLLHLLGRTPEIAEVAEALNHEIDNPSRFHLHTLSLPPSGIGDLLNPAGTHTHTLSVSLSLSLRLSQAACQGSGRPARPLFPSISLSVSLLVCLSISPSVQWAWGQKKPSATCPHPLYVIGLCGDVKASYLSLSLSRPGLRTSSPPKPFSRSGKREKRIHSFAVTTATAVFSGPSASHFTQKERPNSPPDEQYEISPMETASTIPVSQGFTTPPSPVTSKSRSEEVTEGYS